MYANSERGQIYSKKGGRLERRSIQHTLVNIMRNNTGEGEEVLDHGQEPTRGGFRHPLGDGWVFHDRRRAREGRNIQKNMHSAQESVAYIKLHSLSGGDSWQSPRILFATHGPGGMLKVGCLSEPGH